MSLDEKDIPVEETAPQEPTVDDSNLVVPDADNESAEPLPEEVDEITLDGEPLLVKEAETKEPAPQWAKDLRKSVREKDRQIKELRKKLETPSPRQEEEIPSIGEKPTLAQFDYDEEEHAKALEQYVLQKARVENLQANRQKEQEITARKQSEEINNKVTNYSKQKSELKLDDFEEAEDRVTEHLNMTQQAIILKGSQNPALLVYALGTGKDNAKVKEIAKITDPVEFAFKVAQLEAKIQVKRKSPPPPLESTVRGNAIVSDRVLEELKKEAHSSGNWSKVSAYRRDKGL